MKKAIIISFSIIIIFFLAVYIFLNISNDNPSVNKDNEELQGTAQNWKILHIMSYHSPWKWTDDQLNGFKNALSGMEIEYKVFQMDAKHNSTVEARVELGREAAELIKTWHPDLVYTTDDAVQEYVTRAFSNSDIPFVFSGVNAYPEKYDLNNALNVTGVLEREHFVESVKLIQAIVPGIKNIAVIIDDDSSTWEGVLKRMRDEYSEFPDISFEIWEPIITFREYKEKILDAQDKIDAIALIGVFTFKDEKNNNVDYTEVLKWTAENSSIPDFSFWKDRISYGTLCTVTVSGYEQGYSAGILARKILEQNTVPADLPILPTIKGEPVISLARARDLNIQIPAEILLTAEIIEEYAWE